MRWRIPTDHASTDTPKQKGFQALLQGIPTWIRRALGAVAFALLAYGLMNRSLWEKAADLADDDKWRPLLIAGLVGLAALLWPLFKRASAGALAVAAGVSALLAAVFVVLPNFEPPTVDSFEFKNFGIERDVSLEDYSRHYPVASLLSDGHWRFPPEGDDRLGRPGTVVLFDTDVKGRADEEIEIRWYLFDASTQEHLVDGRPIDPLCRYLKDPSKVCLSRTPHRRDSDVSGFEIWVDTTDYATVQCFFIRLEAVSGGTRLSAADSPSFPGEGRAAADCAVNG